MCLEKPTVVSLCRLCSNYFFVNKIVVTDGVEGVCVDPGEREAILEAGGVRGPSLPGGGGKGGQLASDSGGG
jgi:hypothetical protein